VTDPTPETVDGRLLAVRREEMHLAIADVADRLLLSRLQVRSLESGDVKAFYNRAFYDQAIKRYQELLGVPGGQPSSTTAPALPEAAAPIIPASPQGTDITSEEADTPAAEELVDQPGAAPMKDPHNRSGVLATLLVLTALASGVYAVTHLEQLRGFAGAWLASAPGPDTATVGQGSGPGTAEEAAGPPADTRSGPAETVTHAEATDTAPAAEETAAAAADTRPATAAAAPTSRRPGDGYQIEAQGLCWVFTRDANGKETEVTLRPGERIAFPGPLTFLAIGDINAISLRIDGVERDLAGLSKDGRVVRLRQADLDTLRSSAMLR
jgi:hypothetical protein